MVEIADPNLQIKNHSLDESVIKGLMTPKKDDIEETTGLLSKDKEED